MTNFHEDIRVARRQAWMAEAVEQVTSFIFPASDGASCITGAVLPAAGGDLG